MKPFALFPLRLTLGVMLFIFGVQKIVAISATAGYAESIGLPWARVLVGAAAVVEIVSALLIILGFLIRYAALVVAAYLFAIILVFDLTLLLTPFSALTEQFGIINLLKNITLFGAAFSLYFTGPGGWALD